MCLLPAGPLRSLRALLCMLCHLPGQSDKLSRLSTSAEDKPHLSNGLRDLQATLFTQSWR